MCVCGDCARAIDIFAFVFADMAFLDCDRGRSDMSRCPSLLSRFLFVSFYRKRPRIGGKCRGGCRYVHKSTRLDSHYQGRISRLVDRDVERDTLGRLLSC